MRRSIAGLLKPAALCAVATIACLATAMADDDGNAAGNSGPRTPDAAAAPPGAQTAPSAPAIKSADPAHMIPLDGLDLEDGMKPNKLVRALTAERPDEELIVCVAGCFDKRSRVIYAQPIEGRGTDVAAPSAEGASLQPTAAEPAKPTPPAEAVTQPAATAKPGAGADANGAALPQLVPSAAGNALRGPITGAADGADAGSSAPPAEAGDSAQPEADPGEAPATP